MNPDPEVARLVRAVYASQRARNEAEKEVLEAANRLSPDGYVLPHTPESLYTLEQASYRLSQAIRGRDEADRDLFAYHDRKV